MVYQIDEIDKKILKHLIKNARKPFLEIARDCGVSGAAIHQRVHKLEQNGIITGSYVSIRPVALGFSICAFISISLAEASRYPEVVAALKKIPEVVECHFITGKYALMIKIYCQDHDHLMRVLINTIQNIPYISSTETVISLEQAIYRQIGVK